MENDSFHLSLEQEFQIRLVEESANAMSREQMADLLVQLSRLMMIKDNVIRSLVKNDILQIS
ncbi:MAG: NblA/ycf18 family protein [Oculatellaceae cyanobacterium Prado106]|jgi:hypothetical protein|nr:NblA/ycf18 family protein [Oculatellaceae cyanobacterium Prado106]